VKSRKWSLLGGSAVVVGVVVYLFVTGMRDTMVYYFTVGEVLAKEGKIGKGARVNGHVVPGTIHKDVMNLRLEFGITDGKQTLPVVYRGITPDTFKEGAEVVVEGKYDQAGKTFQAHTLLAKCPTKYEAESSASRTPSNSGKTSY